MSKAEILGDLWFQDRCFYVDADCGNVNEAIILLDYLYIKIGLVIFNV